MRIAFDEGACTGSGICESVAEDVFRIGDDGLMALATLEVADDRMDEVELAVSRCPTGSIAMVDEP